MTTKQLAKLKAAKFPAYLDNKAAIDKRRAESTSPEEKKMLENSIEFAKLKNELQVLIDPILAGMGRLDAVRERMNAIAHELYAYYEQHDHGGSLAVYWYSAGQDLFPDGEDEMRAEAASYRAYESGREDAAAYWRPRLNRLKRRLEKYEKAEGEALRKRLDKRVGK
jgi:hypothetical protein